MRYIAKIHVLDVMDQVVVSGYVYDADPLTDPDHTPLEFSYQVPGVGQDEPLAWMLNSLYRALVDSRTPAAKGSGRGPAEGRSHTISGTGDTA